MIQKCTIHSIDDVLLHPDRDTTVDNQRAAYDHLAAFTDQLTNLLDAWNAIPMGRLERRIGHGAVQLLGDVIGLELAKEKARAGR